MSHLLKDIGLTDWTSFAWGAGAMFTLIVIVIGIIAWTCHGAPTIDEYEAQYRPDHASDPGEQERQI